MTNVISRLFNRTTTITRPSLVDTGHGGSTREYESVAVGVRCALRVATQQELMSAAQVESKFDHVLYVPFGTNVRRGDHFTMSAIDYRVIEVEDAAYRGHHLEVKCVREID